MLFTKKGKKRVLKRDLELFLLILPSTILIFLLKYLPIPGMYIAFVDYRNHGAGFFGNLFKSKFVGFDNFLYLFSTSMVGTIFRNTILYNLVFIVVSLVGTVTVAIMINELLNSRIKKISQTFLFLPYFLSWVAISYMMNAFFTEEGGILNNILAFFGKDSVYWYGAPQYWPFILVIMNFWKGVGYGTVIYISALKGIDRTLYESAVMDGASKWQQTKSITLPMLKPMMTILTILAVGGILNSDFGLFYHLPKNSGHLSDVTTTLDVFVYRTLMVTNNVGLSAAADFFKSIVGFFLILITNAIVRKLDNENSLF